MGVLPSMSEVLPLVCAARTEVNDSITISRVRDNADDADYADKKRRAEQRPYADRRYREPRSTVMTTRLSCKAPALAFALLVFVPGWSAAQSMERDAYVLPPESVQDLFRRDKNMAALDRLSPDGDHFFIPLFQELTDLKLMSQRTLRLAMLEIVPHVNREWRQATYGNYGLNVYSLSSRRTYPVKVPRDSF